MSSRLFAATALAVLAGAAPATAQEVVGTPQIDIGEAAAVAGTVIKDGSQKVGTLDVERLGDKITVTANFTRKPPGRRAAICLKVAGDDKRCMRRTSRRGLKLTLDDTADFATSLRATARSGGAFGAVEL
jgi:hypothetical protein